MSPVVRLPRQIAKAKRKKMRCRALGCRVRTGYIALVDGVHVRLCAEHRLTVQTLADLKTNSPPGVGATP